MAPKNGLQGSLDLTMESMFSSPAPVVAKASPAIEPVQVAPEEKMVEPKKVCKSGRKNKEDKAIPRTVYLTDSVFQRLQLMAIMQKKRISGVISDLLDKSAENLTIRKVS